jgi:hypothetical protein
VGLPSKGSGGRRVHERGAIDTQLSGVVRFSMGVGGSWRGTVTGWWAR